MSTEEAVVAEVPVTGVEAETDKAKKAPKEKKVPKEKKPSAAKKPVAHPPYAEMISEAIATLKERTGSSSVAIGKYVEEKHGGKLPTNFRKQLTVQLKKLAAAGKLTKVKNSFKLPAARPVTDAKPKAVKPAAKTKAPKASPKAKAKTAPAAAAAKPRGRPPKAAKTSTKASPAKAAKKAAPAAKKDKAAATLKKAAAAASPARKGAARKAKK